MAEGTDSAPLNVDPRGIRPRLMHTIAVMMFLTMRHDLPVAGWQVEPYKGSKPGTGEPEGCPTLRGQLHYRGEATPRAALQRWARAFDVEVTEQRYLSAGQIHAHIRFYCRGVPVEIVTVIAPGEPEEPGEVGR